MRNILTTITVLLVLLVPTHTLATPGILKMFIAKYPSTEGSQLASCRTCHMPVQNTFLNSYAFALKNNGLDFSATEFADSDGDTVSNIDEISDNQLPGSQAQAHEIFLFTNRQGAITFNHQKHSLATQYLSGGKCDNCHSIEAFPKKFDDNSPWQKIAHSVCKGCHKKSGNKKAPTRCYQCHDKSKKRSSLSQSKTTK